MSSENIANDITARFEDAQRRQGILPHARPVDDGHLPTAVPVSPRELRRQEEEEEERQRQNIEREEINENEENEEEQTERNKKSLSFFYYLYFPLV